MIYGDCVGSVVCVETIRDSVVFGAKNAVPAIPQDKWPAIIERLQKHVVAHEVGHQFGLLHQEGGIMSATALEMAEKQFSPISVDRVRSSRKP